MDPYIITLKKYFGFDQFRDKQLEIIRAVLIDKKDVCAIMFTGAGKSLCYQFPAVHTETTCLVISPLIALMNDQEIKLNNLNIPICCLNSTVKNKVELKTNINNGEYRLVYMTPEYLLTQETFITNLYDAGILEYVAIDESHCASTWGNDFRSAYKKLGVLKEWMPGIPIIALTATATPKVQKDIINILNQDDPLIVKTTFNRTNLFLNVTPKTDITSDLLCVLKKGEPTIIYCQTKKMTEDITEKLKKHGFLCDYYHAGMDTVDRHAVHTRFSDNKISCVVCTIAFGMGIDLTIRKVIHYGIPKDMESYYQEIGRAGRDGINSECHLFFSLSDMQTNNYFINQIADPVYRDHMTQLACSMKNFIFSSTCRRKFILNYFGEEYNITNCKMCDNCLKKNNYTTEDFSKEAGLLFRTFNLTDNMYGAGMIVNVLRGSGAKTVPDRFRRSPLFGAGKSYPEEWWKMFIRLLINLEYIKEKSVPGGRAFTLFISPKALTWLRGYTVNNTIALMIDVPKEMRPRSKLIVEMTEGLSEEDAAIIEELLEFDQIVPIVKLRKEKAVPLEKEKSEKSIPSTKQSTPLEKEKPEKKDKPVPVLAPSPAPVPTPKVAKKQPRTSKKIE